MKKIKYLLLILLSLFLYPMTTFAQNVEISSYDELSSCVNIDANTCKLKNDIVLESVITITKEITLDLNGYSITVDDELSGTTGIIIVNHGGELTINDSIGTGSIISGDNFYAAVQLTSTNDVDNTKTASLIVNNGVLDGFYYAIVGNGSVGRDNTSIIVNGGNLKSGYTGIYHPQKGDLIINDGVITGAKTGIEIRSGNLEVNGGTITGNGIPVEVSANGSGTTTIGAGIAIAQHTTSLEINVLIKGGTINGFSALYQATPEVNNDASKISLEITNGTFNNINGGTVVVYSEDLTKFTTGGTYNNSLLAEYIKNGYESQVINNSYVVSKIEPKTDVPTINLDEIVEKIVVGVSDEEKTQSILIESLNEFLKTNELLADLIEDKNVTVSLDVVDIDKTNVEQNILNSINEVAKDAKIVNYFDISIAIKDTNTSEIYGNINELKNNIVINILLSEELKNKDPNITRNYYIIRSHINEDGTIKTEKLPTTLAANGNYLSFESSLFSTYALVYEDIENVVDENPPTFDSIENFILIGILSIVSLTALVLYLKKAKINQ